MRNLLKMAVVLGVLLLFIGCQTTIPVSFTRPANLNMSGVRRVAIASDNTQVTSEVSQRLTATGVYTVVPMVQYTAWQQERDQWARNNQSLQALMNYQAQATQISAAQLTSEYATNVFNANTRYGSRGLRITGVVSQIGQSARGRYFVRLDGTNNDSVAVYFNNDQALGNLRAGQTITVIGDCIGYQAPDMEDTAEILRILGAGQTINIVDARFPLGEISLPGFRDPPVDAVITLRTSSQVRNETRTEQRQATDSNGRVIRDAQDRIVYRDVAVYDRSVTVNIAYNVMRIENNSVIGQGTKTATSARYSNEDISRLPSEADLVSRTVGRPLGEFISEIVPTRQTTSITLAKESSNKDAKKEMRTVNQLIKSRNYTGAAAAYGRIYARYRNFAAGYNQAVLTEASAGTEAALQVMEAIVNAHPSNSTAQTTLRNMQSRMAANQRAAAQLSQ